MEERSILALKDALKVNLGEQKISDALNNLVSAVIDSKILEIEKCVDAYYKPVFNDDIKVAIAATPIGRLAPLTEPVSYVNTGKSSDEEIDEELNDEILRQLQLKESSQEKQDKDSTSIVEAMKHINDLYHKGYHIDFIELSETKDLHPNLQFLFKEFLRWDIVIKNTYTIREDILVELLRDMDKQDVSFICSNHNISDNFIEKYPELIDWDALLTFNRTPSEKVLFKCYKYIPWKYKSTAYKQLICKQIFESTRPTDEE